MPDVKCPNCGKTFNRNVVPNKKIGNRYYHLTCLDPKQEQDAIDKDALWAYCKSKFGEDYQFVVFKKETDKLTKEYKYSYGGILKSLIWFYDIRNHQVEVEERNRALGIVPYIYDSAKDYYYNIYMSGIANKNFKPKNNSITIEIESPRVEKKLPKLFFEEDDE